MPMAKAAKTATIATTMTMLLAATLGGCCATCPKVSAPDATLPADDGSAAFLHRVSSEPTVSQNQAMRGMLLLAEGEDPHERFVERVEALQDRGIVAGDWRLDANEPLTKGRLAYMVYQAADVPGGATLTLTGPSERYCLRELQYRGIMSQGLVTTPVTGMEYVAVLNRADTWMREGTLPETISGTRGR